MINNSNQVPISIIKKGGNENENKPCQFGELYYANLPVIVNSRVQQGLRPVLVISNNMCNLHSPVVSIVPLTTSITKAKIPTHVAIEGYGLHMASTILTEQIISLDKHRLQEIIGDIGESDIKLKVMRALRTQLNMVA